jgi:hypothetical protein
MSEKSMILSQFGSHSVALPRCRGSKMAQKGDFAGVGSFAIGPEEIPPFL